jgi:hypothetical protein
LTPRALVFFGRASIVPISLHLLSVASPRASRIVLIAMARPVHCGRFLRSSFRRVGLLPLIPADIHQSQRVEPSGNEKDAMNKVFIGLYPRPISNAHQDALRNYRITVAMTIG